MTIDAADVVRRLEELAEGHDRMAAPFTFKGKAKYPAPKTGNREFHEDAAKTLRDAATLIETLVREIAGMRSMDAITMRRAREQSHLRDARIKSMRKELKRQARDLAVHRAIVDTLITAHVRACHAESALRSQSEET